MSKWKIKTEPYIFWDKKKGFYYHLYEKKYILGIFPHWEYRSLYTSLDDALHYISGLDEFEVSDSLIENYRKKDLISFSNLL